MNKSLFWTVIYTITGLMMLCLWSACHRAEAQPQQVVANAGDSGPGSLRQVVADAAPGDEVIFSSQLADETIPLTSGPIIIDKNLTITGPGADSLTISGSNMSGVFVIQADVIATITSLSITDGFAELNGGGIWTDRGVSLTINRLKITGNQALDNGGGIYVGANAVTRIFNSTISANEAQGTLSPNGGGIYNAGGEVMIENSILSDNKSTRGGGIWNAGSGAMEIENTLVTNNTALSEGGGVFNNNRLLITNSTISKNHADVEAGGIKNRGIDTLTVINSTISGNSSGRAGGVLNEFMGTALIRNVTIYGNRSESSGAGIWNAQDGNMSVYSTIVASNVESIGIGSDLIDLGTEDRGVTSEGFNFIGNGDADNDVAGSQRFDRLLTDFVGFTVFPLDPFLDSLISHGGITEAHVPLTGSPVIDNGDCRLTSLAFDQLGGQRVVDISGPAFRNAGDGCDIGAVEATRSIALSDEPVVKSLAKVSALKPAFPNPFQDQTTFQIALPHAQDVTITLHNLLGQPVRQIHAGWLLPGIVYSFKIDASDLASGIYTYRASSPVLNERRSVVLVK